MNGPLVNVVPKEVKSKESTITILWSDGHASRYAARNLRLACRCAACVDEWTHENLIQADTIPPVIKARQIQVVGHYALHFDWSDGHSTGLYAYDYLRSLCECDTCKAPRTFSV